MGLLDGALGQVAGSLLNGQGGAQGGDAAQAMLGGLLQQFGGGSGSSQGLLAAAMTLVQQQGGLEAIVQKLQSGGLGDVVQSWVGTGANAPVTGAQLQDALGGDVLQSVATQAGVSPEAAGTGLASVLPELVNQLTPGGSLPANSGDLLKSVMGMLNR
ncbi:MAG TPA: DUF937 domain-containing protein [Gemmatimonas aurantiaca]|uniref:DUF937 domain-containing protein n=3 Tax=Gemmatimonas aurantiaca TaxID=173480 RepID=C1AAH9_GEMAT|nr:hypothetical protein GAU_2735 [Gemmatimonas aurantiaca T-27]HCT58214.1 DUF937 domain-containing protein [Gemmatimonas aurantiaca]